MRFTSSIGIETETTKLNLPMVCKPIEWCSVTGEIPQTLSVLIDFFPFALLGETLHRADSSPHWSVPLSYSLFISKMPKVLKYTYLFLFSNACSHRGLPKGSEVVSGR